MKYQDHDNRDSALLLRIHECKASYPLHDTGVLKNCIDIGANIGTISLLASKKFEEVIAIEANKDSFECMKSILCKENISNVHIYNRAVHNLSGEFINIYKIDEGGKEHSGNASTEVIHSSNNIPLTGETESVQTINLEDVLKIADSKYIDYMKIDCEGAEYNFLINKELSKIFFIIGEYHEGYLGEKKLNELWAHIRLTHELDFFEDYCIFTAELKKEFRSRCFS